MLKNALTNHCFAIVLTHLLGVALVLTERGGRLSPPAGSSGETDEGGPTRLTYRLRFRDDGVGGGRGGARCSRRRIEIRIRSESRIEMWEAAGKSDVGRRGLGVAVLSGHFFNNLRRRTNLKGEFSKNAFRTIL